MADSFSKKEQQKKKAKKKLEKQKRREEHKLHNNKGKSFEDMIVYLDEFGNITDVPPEQQHRTEVKLEDIQLGAAPVIDEPDPTGVVVSFFDDKAYGFIKEDNGGETIFVHASNLEEPIKEGDKVTFQRERTPKGFAAIKVKKTK